MPVRVAQVAEQAAEQVRLVLLAQQAVEQCASTDLQATRQ